MSSIFKKNGHDILLLLKIGPRCSLQVPYYLGELTEKVAEEDRIQILKASQAKLKVLVSFDNGYYPFCFQFSLSIAFQSPKMSW